MVLCRLSLISVSLISTLHAVFMAKPKKRPSKAMSLNLVL